MALSSSFVTNSKHHKCYSQTLRVDKANRVSCRNLPRKGSLLATFSKSALLIKYNELIHKKENYNQTIHTSLNSCISIQHRKSRLSSYKYKSKKLYNDSQSSTCAMKNESTMTGT